MTKTGMDRSGLLAKPDDGDFPALSLRLILETHVEGLIGTDKQERNADRATWRNG